MTANPKKKLTHIDGQGRVKMVDVGAKPVSRRRARAEGFVRMAPATLALAAGGELAKGDLFNAARLAGIMGAKRAAELIPLCHPLPLNSIVVEVEADFARSRVEIRSEVATEARTGVEMEALAAVACAALTVYDMAKAADREMTIEGIRLVAKTKEAIR